MPDQAERLRILEGLRGAEPRTLLGPYNTAPVSPEDYIRFYERYGGVLAQFRQSLRDRRFKDRMAAEQGLPRDLNLRDAEHALLVNSDVGRMGPIGKAVATPIYLGAVPIYSAMKWISQNVLQPAGIPFPGQQSTPPSWREVYWGLAPIFGNMPTSGKAP